MKSFRKEFLKFYALKQKFPKSLTNVFLNLFSRMNRAVLRWLQTLDLSLSYRNPRDDFASGFLISEIVGHYIKLETVYVNSVKEAQRKDNWEQLQKIFDNPQNHLSVSKELCAKVLGKQEKAYIQLLDILYERFTHRKSVHVKLGDITTKAVAPPPTDVQDIEKPDIPKEEVPEKEPEVPPVVPKRQRFIGSSSQRSNPSDLTPITFESASVVKSGPGFLQLRNSTTNPTLGVDENQQLNSIYDAIIKEDPPSSQSLTSLAHCLSDPLSLLSFINNFPIDQVIQYLQLASPYFTIDSSSFLIYAVGTYFIPILYSDPETQISLSTLVDFICSLTSSDPFSEHFLLSHLINLVKHEDII